MCVECLAERMFDVGLGEGEGYAVSDGRWAEGRDNLCWVFCLWLTHSFGVRGGTGD
jgi:hypothetical protein